MQGGKKVLFQLKAGDLFPGPRQGRSYSLSRSDPRHFGFGAWRPILGHKPRHGCCYALPGPRKRGCRLAGYSRYSLHCGR